MWCKESDGYFSCLAVEECKRGWLVQMILGSERAVGGGGWCKKVGDLRGWLVGVARVRGWRV